MNKKSHWNNELVVGNYVITKDIKSILTDIKRQLTNGKLDQFRQSGSDNIVCTCPIHSGGHEKRPSAFIYTGSEKANYATFHCFTCQTSLPFTAFVGKCFDKPEEWAKRWLIENSGYEYRPATSNFAPSITLDRQTEEETFLDEDILTHFDSYHPYMTQRKLTDEVIKKFDIKYDKETQSIVFPVRDVRGRLKFLTRRSVNSKQFIIDKGASKSDIFALDKVVSGGYKWCIVAESQINALTAWSYGYPAIALLGAGTPKEQIDTLNKTNIRLFVLCYDNDPAGNGGAAKFKKLIRDDRFVVTLTVPKGKDLNDLTKSEFDGLLLDAGVIE